MKYLIIIPFLALVTIAVVGKVKFDYVDSPFVGDPVTYASDEGVRFQAHYRADDSVQVSFLEADGEYQKSFIAERARGASGAKYLSNDGAFEFWNKGDEATIFGEGDLHIVSGVDVSLSGNTQTQPETIYFDPQNLTWNDAEGLCRTCIAENGFGADGQIEGAQPVFWQEVLLSLKDDAEENPPIADVREVFETHYSVDPAQFGTHVSLNDDVYRIVFATGSGEVDVFAREGALRAWYYVAPME